MDKKKENNMNKELRKRREDLFLAVSEKKRGRTKKKEKTREVRELDRFYVYGEKWDDKTRTKVKFICEYSARFLEERFELRITKKDSYSVGNRITVYPKCIIYIEEYENRTECAIEIKTSFIEKWGVYRDYGCTSIYLESLLLDRIVADFDSFLNKIDYEFVLNGTIIFFIKTYKKIKINNRSTRQEDNRTNREDESRYLFEINNIKANYQEYNDLFMVSDVIVQRKKKPLFRVRLFFSIGPFLKFSKKFSVYNYNYWKENIKDDEQDDIWNPKKIGSIVEYNNIIVARYKREGEGERDDGGFTF